MVYEDEVRLLWGYIFSVPTVHESGLGHLDGHHGTEDSGFVSGPQHQAE